MKIHNCTQGSEEWLSVRKGRPTASRFKEILTPTGKLSKSAEGYMNELIAETLCPEWQKFEGNAWTDRGIELEPAARDCFRDVTQLNVDEVGFITRDDEIVGCSPDGLVIDAVEKRTIAGLELKCPAPHTHVAYMARGELPSAYKVQVHGGMAVTGLDSWWFMSYCPGMAPLILEVRRDPYTQQLERTLDQFLIEYGSYKTKLLAILEQGAMPRRDRTQTVPF